MKQSRTLLFLAVATALIIAGLAVWALRDQGSAEDPGNREQIAAGQKVYQQYCASCHGSKLEGEQDWKVRKPNGRLPAPPHDASGHTWHHPDEQLFSIVRDGLAANAPAGYATDMPAFKDLLSDAEIRSTLAYIKSRWPQDIRDRQREISAQAADN